MNLDITAPKFEDAICATLDDKDFFFPKVGREEAERLPQLRAMCGDCMHRKECLEFALDKDIRFGFWGGATASERADLKSPSRSLIGDTAQAIINLDKDGYSTNEIARRLKTSIGYINRCITRFATREGVIQSHPSTKGDSSQ